MSGIDRNRGALIRKHPAGMRVAMYYDNPGEFFDENGVQVSEEVAQRAGFDVGKMAKQRRKQKLLREFQERLDREFEETSNRVDQAAESDGEGVYIRYEREGKYSLRDADGERLTPGEADLDSMKELYESVTDKKFKGKVVDAPEDDKPAAKTAAKKGGGGKRAGRASQQAASKGDEGEAAAPAEGESEDGGDGIAE